jgi:hypothetical protein
MKRRTRLSPAELYLKPPVPFAESPVHPAWPGSFATGGLQHMPVASPGEIAAGRVVSLADYRHSRRTAASGDAP